LLIVVLTISNLDPDQTVFNRKQRMMSNTMTAQSPQLEETVGMNGAESFDEDEAASYEEVEVDVEDAREHDERDQRQQRNHRDGLVIADITSSHETSTSGPRHNRDPRSGHVSRTRTENELTYENRRRKTISWMRDSPASHIPESRTREFYPVLKAVGSDDCTATTVSINHTFSSETTPSGRRDAKNNSSSSIASRAATTRGFILGMSKPFFTATVAIVLASTAGGAAGLWGWMSIVPGLNNQIQELEREVSRLEEQNDRYEVLNSELNATVVDLQQLNQDLKETAVRLAISVHELNVSVTNLQIVNQQLREENVRYSVLNDALQGTARNLSDTVDQLQDNVGNLTLQNQELASTTTFLKEETERLNGLNDDLSRTVLMLNESLTDITAANAKLSSLNTDLSRIVSFLNDTTTNTTNTINHTLDELTRAISEQIAINRVAVVQSLENRYMQQAMFWDCSFRDVFRGESFILDEDSPIILAGNDNMTTTNSSSSSNNYIRVMEYVEDRVLSKLCLDASDFERYIMDIMMMYNESAAGAGAGAAASATPTPTPTPTPIRQLSANKIYRAVAEYTMAAMSYYFPAKGEEGLTVDDWAEAKLDCHDVPPFAFEPLAL
jgi:methyl-accepting chemotaxis protein